MAAIQGPFFRPQDSEPDIPTPHIWTIARNTEPRSSTCPQGDAHTYGIQETLSSSLANGRPNPTARTEEKSAFVIRQPRSTRRRERLAETGPANVLPISSGPRNNTPKGIPIACPPVRFPSCCPATKNLIFALCNARQVSQCSRIYDRPIACSIWSRCIASQTDMPSIQAHEGLILHWRNRLA